MSLQLEASREQPVVVIGAGPVGLAALANLLDRGIPAMVVEAAAGVGEHFRQYGPVRLFSPWKFNIAEPIVRRLATSASGWIAPDGDALPLASEILERVLRPFAELPEVKPAIRLRHRVLAVSRHGVDKVKSAGRERAPFALRVQTPDGERTIRAASVIDASGTWSSPNPLGGHGLPAEGEHEHRARIFYGIPDVLGAHRPRYAGKRVLVVGSGHSAANTLLALAQLAQSATTTSLLWAVRSAAPVRAFGGGEADQLPARGELGSALERLATSGRLVMHADFRVTALNTADDRTLTVVGEHADGSLEELRGVDEIVCATGQRPDLDMTRELRLRLDPWLESTEALGPLIDPNVHSCGSVPPHGHRELGHPEPGFYTVGVKSYGRAPTFLMLTGYEQVRSVVAAIAGDVASADKVELVLPETGVCNTSASVSDAGCCSVSPATGVPVKIPVAIGRAHTAAAPVREPAAAGCCCR
jgi:hypothetical protein